MIRAQARGSKRVSRPQGLSTRVAEECPQSLCQEVRTSLHSNPGERKGM